MNKLVKTLIAGIGSLALMASAASAATHTFPFTLAPEPGGTGSGSGTATYDDVSGLFSWNYTFTGLTGEVQAAHFHGGPSPEVGIPYPETSPNTGSYTINATQGAALKSGAWYLNIHTDHLMGGELKGFLILSNAGKLAELQALKTKIDALEKKYKKTKSKLSAAKAKKMKKSIKKLLAQYNALNAS